MPAHPTAEAQDFRKITTLGSLQITGRDLSSFTADISIAEAVKEIVRLRSEGVHVVAFTETLGAMLAGRPDEVLPILNALLTHADETDHLEEQQ